MTMFFPPKQFRRVVLKIKLYISWARGQSPRLGGGYFTSTLRNFGASVRPRSHRRFFLLHRSCLPQVRLGFHRLAQARIGQVRLGQQGVWGAQPPGQVSRLGQHSTLLSQVSTRSCNGSVAQVPEYIRPGLIRNLQIYSYSSQVQYHLIQVSIMHNIH